MYAATNDAHIVLDLRSVTMSCKVRMLDIAKQTHRSTDGESRDPRV